MIQVKFHVFKKINELSQIMKKVLITLNLKLLGNFLDELIKVSKSQKQCMVSSILPKNERWDNYMK